MITTRTTNQELIGLSTDSMPTAADIGGRLTFLDTGQSFLWTGTEWREEAAGSLQYVWSTSLLKYVKMTQPVINTDTLTVASTTDLTKIGGVAVGATNALYVQPGTGAIFPVSGDFYPATQPVSAASLPLPSGAATSALQSTIESLVDTLQELVQRLAPLGGSISMVGGQALRVSYGGGTFAVSGPITDAQFQADYHVAGRNYPLAVALHNMAAQANINNVTAA